MYARVKNAFYVECLVFNQNLPLVLQYLWTGGGWFVTFGEDMCLHFNNNYCSLLLYLRSANNIISLSLNFNLKIILDHREARLRSQSPRLVCRDGRIEGRRVGGAGQVHMSKGVVLSLCWL